MFTARMPARINFAFAAAVALSACGATTTAHDAFEPLMGADAGRILQSHRWHLDAATEASGRRLDALFPLSSRGFSLAFEGAMVIVDGGCNTMRGSYALDADGRLVVGRLAATMKACEPALMQADATLAQLLANPLRASLAQGAMPKILFVTLSRESLMLAGELTHEARYGPAALMFFEVSAWRVPCGPPPSDPTCLQVRERAFDEQGLSTGVPGEWRAFPDAIAGYTHRQGERTVLRVKRFQRSTAPADTSTYVYVLDLVVETELVKH